MGKRYDEYFKRREIYRERNVDFLEKGVDFLDIDSVFSREIEERRVGKECRSRWSPYH